MTPPAIEPHTAAMLSRLESTGLPVGDGRKPEGAGWQDDRITFVTYLVLRPLNHRRKGPDASIGDAYTDPQLHYQVDAVGRDRKSAETASDLAAAALLRQQAFDIPGRHTVLIVHETSLGVAPEEDVSPPAFVAVERYRLDTSA